MKKTVSLLFVLSFVAFSLFGCKPDDTVKIGIVVPLTGSNATYGKDLKKGMDIAFKEERGFRPLYQNSKSLKTTGLNAMQFLRDAKQVLFYIGDATTTVSLSLAEDAQANGNFLLVPIASGDDIKNKGDLIFMNCPRNEKQAISAAEYVIGNYNGKRVGVIYQQIPYGTEISRNFILELQRNNMDVVFSECVQDVRSELRSVITKARKANLDVIFIPMEYEAGALVLKQCREQGITADFVGTDGAYSQKLIDLAGDAAEGFCFTMFPIDPNSDYYKSFAEKYRKKYRKDPNIFSCYGYESAKHLISAINAVGLDPQDVKDYFLTNVFDSFTGPLTFDLTGEVNRNFGIVMVNNHVFVSK